LPLLNDIHHLTFITADLDRLIAFYERVFGAQVTVDLEEEGLRHAFIEVGPRTVLHPFQVPDATPPGPQPMFQSAAVWTTSGSTRRARRRSVNYVGASSPKGRATVW
jgi:catechol 2,3-dioxygenase-like lactoylglutathione lyase family enzyme